MSEIHLGRELDSLIELSEGMLAQAQAGEWDALVEGENKRRPRLNQIFEDPIAGDRVETVAVGVQRILEIDKQIMALTMARRDALAEEYSAVNQGQQAVRSYGENSGR